MNWFRPGAILTIDMAIDPVLVKISSTRQSYEANHVNSLTVTAYDLLCDWLAQILLTLLYNI